MLLHLRGEFGIGDAGHEAMALAAPGVGERGVEGEEGEEEGGGEEAESSHAVDCIGRRLRPYVLKVGGMRVGALTYGAGTDLAGMVVTARANILFDSPHAGHPWPA
ncbi:hypothetical protein, partial [Stenotrophomonas panacihumi]|uniref:hypothetical protein n=1 Tax=Stenotrophomonas panacihumi TaxID=676599 RepID=UPI001F45F164